METDRECEQAAERAGALLQAIQTYLGDRNLAGARVRFPRGFIRTAWHFQSDLLFISNDTLRRNLSYLWLEIEVHRWVLLRTDLFGPAKEMLIKRVICLIGNAVESTVRGYYGRHVGKNKKYKSIVKQLVDESVIDYDLEADLLWIWDIRNKEHVFLNHSLELGAYGVAHLNRAAKASRRLVDMLNAEVEANLPF